MFARRAGANRCAICGQALLQVETNQRGGALVVMGVNPVTFAARSFLTRQGATFFRTGTRAYPVIGSVRSEQRCLVEPPPGGLRRIWPEPSLLVGHSFAG